MATIVIELSINHRTLIVSYFLRVFSHCYSVIQNQCRQHLRLILIDDDSFYAKQKKVSNQQYIYLWLELKDKSTDLSKAFNIPLPYASLYKHPKAQLPGHSSLSELKTDNSEKYRPSTLIFNFF